MNINNSSWRRTTLLEKLLGWFYLLAIAWMAYEYFLVPAPERWIFYKQAWKFLFRFAIA